MNRFLRNFLALFAPALFFLFFSCASTKNAPVLVYHVTSSETFASDLEKIGAKAIRLEFTSADSRFGKMFYVSADAETALKEASHKGILLRFALCADASILDLTDEETAKSHGYSVGLPHSKTLLLLQDWDLSGIDAIKYPSEKNPGGINYAVENTKCLVFEEQKKMSE